MSIHKDALRQYAIVRAAVSGNEPIAVLHIGQHHTSLVLGAADAAPAVVALNLGLAGVPATLFRSELPTPLELENAISAVEDEVMAAAKRLPPLLSVLSVPVHSADPELQQLASIAQPGRRPGSALSIDDMERVFDGFAAVVLGRPVGSAGIPITRPFVAMLVIVREVMHHLKIATLKVL